MLKQEKINLELNHRQAGRNIRMFQSFMDAMASGKRVLFWGVNSVAITMPTKDWEKLNGIKHPKMKECAFIDEAAEIKPEVWEKIQKWYRKGFIK